MDVRAASIVALQNGGEVVPHPLFPDAPQVVAWDVRGWCESPVFLRRVGEGHWHGDRDLGFRSPKGDVWEPLRFLEQLVPCRKCAGCRRWKQAMWSWRAAIEWEDSFRTWLVTLTFDGGERHRVTELARRRLSARGVEFHSLPPAERHREWLVELWPLVDLLIKRYRRGSMRRGLPPLDISYLAVAEPHKRDWFPHFHLLLHEKRKHVGFGRRQIEGEWRNVQTGVKLGHATAKIVRDPAGARYAAKYLGKFDGGRVRASTLYGQRERKPVFAHGVALPAAAFASDGEDEPPLMLPPVSL